MKIKRWSEYRGVRKKTNKTNNDIELFLLSQLSDHRSLVIEEFCSLYTPVIKMLCKGYLWSNVPLDDLYMCGIEGLIASIDKFDASKEFRFSTYANHYIIGRIRRAVDLTNTTIKRPSHINRIIAKINKMNTDDYENCEELEEFSSFAIRNALNTKSQSMTVLDDAENESYSDEYSFIKNANIESALKSLPIRESLSIILKFGLFKTIEHTYKELDDILLCDSEILVKRALNKLKGKIVEPY